jgi:hypothetical protein
MIKGNARRHSLDHRRWNDRELDRTDQYFPNNLRSSSKLPLRVHENAKLRRHFLTHYFFEVFRGDPDGAIGRQRMSELRRALLSAKWLERELPAYEKTENKRD